MNIVSTEANPPPPPAPSRRGFWVKLAASKVLVLSILAHLLFGTGATYFVVQQIQAKRKLTFAGGPPTTNPSKRAIEHKVSMAKKKNSMSAPAQAKRITTAGLSKISLPDMPSMPSATDLVPGKMAGMGGTGFGPGFGGGGGTMGGGGSGSGINFFGMRAQVKSIVFVFDISGSMIMGKKDVESYKALEREIAKVITGLGAGTKFGLVAFAKDADSYRTDPVDARNDEKTKAIAWLKNMSPEAALDKADPKITRFKEYKNGRHQGTRADLGLERAFKMKPDTIFFVSDGEPSGATPGDVLKQVAETQSSLPKPVVINAVAYMADNGQKFMKELAENNKGTFREVNPKKK